MGAIDKNINSFAFECYITFKVKYIYMFGEAKKKAKRIFVCVGIKYYISPGNQSYFFANIYMANKFYVNI